MNLHKAWKAPATLATLAILVIGCTTEQSHRDAAKPAPLAPQQQPDQPTTRLGSDPVSDLSGQIIVGILTAVGEPVRDAAGRTVIHTPDLVNRSSARNEGVADLGARLRAELAAAGRASGLTFVATDQLRASGPAHYLLHSEVYTVTRQGQRYWEVFFTLHDVNPQTGAREDRRWENARGYLIAR